MGFFDDIASGTSNLINGGGGTGAGTLGNSYDYLNAFTLLPRLGADNANAATNQDQANKSLKKLQEESAAKLGVLQGQQIGLANDFNSNKNKYQGLIQNQEIKPLRMQMSQKLSDNKLDASRRGILNSGIQQRNDANTISKYKSDYFTGLDNARDKFSSLESDVNEAPIKTGLELQGLNNQSQNDYYRTALQDMQSRNAALSGLGGAIGQIGGSYYANSNSNSKSGGY